MLSHQIARNAASNRRIAGIHPNGPKSQRKIVRKKHTDFIVVQKTAVKMKTQTAFGKVRGMKLHFTDPCKNHIKACQKT